jgi:hypothetical protein
LSVLAGCVVRRLVTTNGYSIESSFDTLGMSTPDQLLYVAYLVQGFQRTVMVRVPWRCSAVLHVGLAQVNTNADAKASPA